MVSYSKVITVSVVGTACVSAIPFTDAVKNNIQIQNTYVSQMESEVYQQWFNDTALLFKTGSHAKDKNIVEANLFLGFSWRLIWDSPYYHYHTGKVEDNCNTYSAVFTPFTGFRIFQQIDFRRRSFRTQHSTTIVYCENGVVTASSTISNQDNKRGINDQKLICINQHAVGTPNAMGCYKIGYRNQISGYFPWFRSESFVAYLFRCPNNVGPDNADKCTNENASPVGPLIGDEPYMALADYHNPLKYGIRIPTFYVPDAMNYIYPVKDYKESQYIDINSIYGPSSPASYHIHSLSDSSTFIEKKKIKKFKFALEVLKRHLPFSDKFVTKYLKMYNFLSNSNKLSILDLERLSSLGIHALAFMKDRQKARLIYERIWREIHPVEFDWYRIGPDVNEEDLMDVESAVKVMEDTNF
jgi:hypothetical protein